MHFPAWDLIRGKGNTELVTTGAKSFVKTPLTSVNYRKTSNISRTLVGNKIVHNSDVVGASPVGAGPTTSSFST